MFRKLLVRCLFPWFLFSSNLAISYYSDHHPRFIGSENVLHSQSHAVSDGMWALAPSAIKHVEYVLLPLGPQNATGSPTIPFLPAQICLNPYICTPVSTTVQHAPPSEIAKSNPCNVHPQTNAHTLPQSLQPISPSHLSGDHTHHNIKYLEQLLDSSLATVSVIQFSGNTLADVLTPRAYDTFKALYALAALDAPASESSTKPRGSKIPNLTTFSDIGNDRPYSSSRSPPLPDSSLAVPRIGRMHVHVSISVDYVMLFSLAGLVAVSCLVVFSICLGFAKGSS